MSTLKYCRRDTKPDTMNNFVFIVTIVVIIIAISVMLMMIIVMRKSSAWQGGLKYHQHQDDQGQLQNNDRSERRCLAR